MFFHNFKYFFKSSVRQKEIVFWVIIFPIVLGSLFKVAFGEISDGQRFQKIPVAVVMNSEDKTLEAALKQVSQGDGGLFDAVFADEKEALKLLKNKEVKGIIYSDGLKMTVSERGIEQTIIKSFMEQYKNTSAMLTEAFMTNPQKAAEVTQIMTGEIKANVKQNSKAEDYDFMMPYFYNLVAMTALFGSYLGVAIPIHNQANISDIGARKSCSPVKKSVSTAAALCAAGVVQMICMTICMTFLKLVLKIDFGDRLWLCYLTSYLAGFVGVSFGFFVGSIGRAGEAVKIGILTTVSLFLCFLSGLMVQNIKYSLEQIGLGWFNRINPAAVIADSIYALSIYENFDIYLEKVAVMVVISVIFCMGGFLLSRKRTFKSL